MELNQVLTRHLIKMKQLFFHVFIENGGRRKGQEQRGKMDINVDLRQLYLLV